MVVIDGPSDSPITWVFAHGAGVPMTAPFMTTVADGVARRGIRVVRFEFPYMTRSRPGLAQLPPDPLDVLRRRFREVVDGLDRSGRVFVGGKSMGGHVASLVAADLPAAGVVILGLPFESHDEHSSSRFAYLRRLERPCLIVQGTADPLGSPKSIRDFVESDSIRVESIPDAGHSFEPAPGSERTLEMNLELAVEHTTRFLIAHA